MAKRTLKYLPVLAVLFATVIGLVLGKDLYPTSLDSQITAPMMVLGAKGPCGLSAIYTSLPPKCRTFDGKFIPVPGTSSYILVTPEGK
jgi:hypothetical protein